MIYRDGLPVFSVPLPSRKELCEFVLKPVSHTVGDFLQFLNEEDHGIDRAVIYTEGKCLSPIRVFRVFEFVHEKD